jgi:FkbM family methyltransferase
MSSIPYVPRRDEIYEFLRGRGIADTYVDVGAASGDVTFALAAGAKKVLAFEPFPGNAALFRKRLTSYPNVELIEKAVSNRRGRTSLFVDSTVQGDEPGWDNQVGYSSIGRIETSIGAAVRSYLAAGKSVMTRRRGATVVSVKTTTIDRELRERVVDFLKVDVQGAERLVLEGARSALQSQRIRLMYLEWTGDLKVERLLVGAGYSIFDSVYVGAGGENARKEFESAGFGVTGQIPLSTGQSAFEMCYTGPDCDMGDTLRKLNRRGQWIQTDLIALPASDKAEYVDFLLGR